MKELAKKNKICLGVEAAFVVIVAALCLITFPYQDSEDWLIALLFFGVPGVVMLGTIYSFVKKGKRTSNARFILSRAFFSFLACFVIESIIILIYFGIKTPQYKLFIFAAGFSIYAMISCIIFTIIYALVCKKK